MPSIMPIAAGSQLHRPIASDRSMAGIISDHTDAATITPAANPSKIFCSRAETVLRTNSTVEAPTIVPAKGIAKIDRVSIIVILS